MKKEQESSKSSGKTSKKWIIEMLDDLHRGLSYILYYILRHPFLLVLQILLCLGVYMGIQVTIDIIQSADPKKYFIDLSIEDLSILILSFFCAVFLAITFLLRKISDNLNDIYHERHERDRILLSINNTLYDINEKMKKDAKNSADSDNGHQQITL